MPVFSRLLRITDRRCASTECSGPLLFYAFTSRRDGIRLDREWFCGPECLELAVRKRIESLHKLDTHSRVRQNARIPLGLLLLSRGVLNRDHLQLVLQRQRMTGENFGDAAQQLGFATADQITAAVAAQWACPVFSLRDRLPATNIQIPYRLLELYQMLPVHFTEDGRRLLIAFVNAVHHQILYTIEQMTSCVADPCFITAQEHTRHIHASSSQFLGDNEVVFEQAMDLSELAHIVRNYAVQSGAAQVRMGRCREYLWTRVWGRKREMDLLFRMRNS